MKAEELMIGDWVMYEGNPTQIEQLGQEGHVFVPERFYDASEHIEPIPLTNEILEKNGFIYDYDVDECVADGGHYITMKGYTYSEDNLLLDYCNGVLKVTDDFKGELCMNVEYVHQVQHALRLLGIDKEIKMEDEK